MIAANLLEPPFSVRATFAPIVYDRCMAIRTNIVIDEVLLQRIMRRYGVHTKTEAIDLALRHLAGQPMSTDDILAMHGAGLIEQVPEDPGPR